MAGPFMGVTGMVDIHRHPEDPSPHKHDSEVAFAPGTATAGLRPRITSLLVGILAQDEKKVNAVKKKSTVVGINHRLHRP
jgi:hypothetical protein